MAQRPAGWSVPWLSPPSARRSWRVHHRARPLFTAEGRRCASQPAGCGHEAALGIVDPAVGPPKRDRPRHPPAGRRRPVVRRRGLHVVPPGRLARRPPALHPVPPRPHPRPAHRQGHVRRGRRLSADGRPGRVRPPHGRPAGGAAGRAVDLVQDGRARPRQGRRGAGRGGGGGVGRQRRRGDLVEPGRRRGRFDCWSASCCGSARTCSRRRSPRCCCWRSGRPVGSGRRGSGRRSSGPSSASR